MAKYKWKRSGTAKRKKHIINWRNEMLAFNPIRNPCREIALGIPDISTLGHIEIDNVDYYISTSTARELYGMQRLSDQVGPDPESTRQEREKVFARRPAQQFFGSMLGNIASVEPEISNVYRRRVRHKDYAGPERSAQRKHIGDPWYSSPLYFDEEPAFREDSERTQRADVCQGLARDQVLYSGGDLCYPLGITEEP